MKIPHCSLRFCFLSLIAATLPLRPAVAADNPPAPSHVLFMGADLSVLHDKKVYVVKDVVDTDLSIRVNGSEVLVPTRRGPVSLKVDAGLKLAPVSAQLDEFKAGPGYTYANDPMRKLEETNRINQQTSDQKDLADAGVPRAQANLDAVKVMTSHYQDQARAQREVSTATEGVRSSINTLDYSTISSGSDSSNLGSGARRMALAEGQFDAMDVSFKVSSPVELERPYMVILFRFHDPAAKVGVNGQVIHAQALDPIGAKPRYVRVLRGGLPTAFSFVDCAVHIYDRGQEVATNQSEMRAELTRDETRQYLVATYCTANKRATLPAAAVSGTLPRVTRAAMSHDQLTRYVYAKVDRDGRLHGTFADAECTTPLEQAGTASALQEIFYAPALEAGKPVDGIARVRFGDL